MTNSSQPKEDFERFWHLYLRDHAQPLTRRLHVIGISIALAGIVAGLFVDDHGVTAIASILIAATMLWAAHRFVEHNRPTGLKGRFDWALRCGARMYWLELTGRLKPELEKAGIASPDERRAPRP
jgi:hypothetical protein